MRALLVSVLIAQLFIPVIGLYESIGVVPIAGTPGNFYYDTSDLGNGVGRADKMTWGRTDKGRTVIFGHDYGAFSMLQYLKPGDQILVFIDSWVATEFTVFDMQVVDIAYGDYLFNVPPSAYELDLITCWGDKRLIVRAAPSVQGSN